MTITTERKPTTERCSACKGLGSVRRYAYAAGGLVRMPSHITVCPECYGLGEIEPPSPPRGPVTRRVERVLASAWTSWPRLARAYRWATEHHLELDNLRRVRSDAFFRGFCCGALTLYLLQWAAGLILHAALV